MMIATEVSTKNARWLPTFRTSSRSVSTPMTIEGTSGVLDLPCTLAMAEANGSRLSRPMVKIIRMPPACTARLHTVMAMSESIRNRLPIVLPSVALTRYGSPEVPSALAWMSGVAISPNKMTRNPATPAAISARRIPGGAFFRGSRVSSASDPAVSKPYITYALISPAAEKRGERPGDLLGPLVDRAGQRVLPGELGKAQRDQELAREDGGPGQGERGAARAEAEEEQLEHPGHDRDVAEPRGERGEEPQRAVQFLLVAELGQFVGVRTRHSHGSSPSRRPDDIIVNRPTPQVKRTRPATHPVSLARGRFPRPGAGRRRRAGTCRPPAGPPARPGTPGSASAPIPARGPGASRAQARPSTARSRSRGSRVPAG